MQNIKVGIQTFIYILRIYIWKNSYLWFNSLCYHSSELTHGIKSIELWNRCSGLVKVLIFVNMNIKQVFLRHFRDPIQVSRIANRVPRISEIIIWSQGEKSGPYRSVPGT